MAAVQTAPRTPGARTRHLRLTVQIEGDLLEIVNAMVVDEPLDPPRRTVGGWVYEWRENGEPVWVDTMQDPLAQRGIARPEEVEHSFGRRRRGDFTIRVPLDREGAARSLELRVYRSAAALPENPDELRGLLTAGAAGQLELVARLDDAAFRRHRQWADVESALGAVKRD
jgi:hypothetical protein